MTTNSTTLSDAPASNVAGETKESKAGMLDKLTLLQKHAQWLFVIIPYLFAWWLPFTWSDYRWTTPSYVLFFQPFIPFLTIALVWAKRERLIQLYRRQGSRGKQSFWMRGNALLFVVGAIMLIFAHLVQIKGLAAGGLVLIAWGVIYQQFGAKILQALILPFVFSALCIPPPDSLAELVMRIGGKVTLGVAANICRFIKRPAFTTIEKPDALYFGSGGYAIDYLQTQSALGMICLNLTALFCLAVMRGYRPLRIVLALVLNLVITSSFNMARVLVAGILGGSSPALSRLFATNQVVIFLIALVAFAISWAIESGLYRIFARSRRRGSRRRSSNLASASASAASIAQSGTFDAVGRAGDIVVSPLETGLRTAGNLWKRSERGLETSLKKMPGRNFNPFSLLITVWVRSEQTIEKGFRLLFPRKKKRRR